VTTCEKITFSGIFTFSTLSTFEKIAFFQIFIFSIVTTFGNVVLFQSFIFSLFILVATFAIHLKASQSDHEKINWLKIVTSSYK
jgi:hypothetical protein